MVMDGVRVGGCGCWSSGWGVEGHGCSVVDGGRCWRLEVVGTVVLMVEPGVCVCVCVDGSVCVGGCVCVRV